MESRRAFAISGSAHGALVAWALISGWLSGAFEDRTVVSEVSLISGAEFAALVERAGEGAPAAAPEPASDPEPDLVPEEPPRPEPEAAVPTTPETAPDAAPEAAPEAAAPAAPRDSTALELDPDPGETPTPAPRVAPRPADRPAPEASVAPEREAAVVPLPAEEAPEIGRAHV